MTRKEAKQAIEDRDWWKKTFEGAPFWLHGYSYRDSASFVSDVTVFHVNRTLALWIRRIRGLE